jgi:two-component system sensor histidine kinase VicK
MKKITVFSPSDDIILNLKVLAREKEVVRRKLAIAAQEKESVRRKLAVTAAKLATTAEKLANTAKEKEHVRRKLVVTAAQLATTAEKLAATAREKEVVRRKLAVTAKKLDISHKTLEKKVLERTRSLEVVRAKEGAILLSIGDGLIATDENGKIILINETAEKLLGKKREEVLGKTYSEITLLEDEKGTPVLLENHPVNMALQKGTKTAGTTYYNMRKDHTKFPVAITVTPVILSGKVVGTIKVFRDITYERDIDKAKTEFVSLASHQLRTPLSTVNWYAEMLLEGDVGELNCKQKKYLDEVYRSNRRMVELVNALLDVSSLELGTFVIEPKSTDICKLARDVVHEQRSQIDTKKIRFKLSCHKENYFMKADPKLLRMVMQNMLSNSVKYTPIGGKVELSISLADKNNIQIKIRDTGYGIPPKQHAKIFTKLFRADNVREKDTDGTGLGLYIVKSIVEKSGGKIWFESPKENKGTTFYVTLPIKGIPKKII